MNVMDPATFAAPATGIIILAIRPPSELWCRPPGYAPKVQVRTSGSCLLRGSDFAHKITQRIAGFGGSERFENAAVLAGGKSK
jgi:hypothetical protein